MLQPTPRDGREQKLGDWLYGQIFDRILKGVYPPRTRLPSETRFAAEFGVSRPVVREAIARLREDRLVTSRRGSGTYVERRPPEAVLSFAPLSSIADMQRCFEFRAALERQAASLAALRHDRARLAAIDEAMAVLREVLAAGALGADADFRFHCAVAEASGNRYFTDTLELLRDHIEFGMQLTRNLSLRRPAERLRQVEEEHERIVAAIAARDAEGAGEAMARHIDNARHRMFEGDVLPAAGGEARSSSGATVASGPPLSCDGDTPGTPGTPSTPSEDEP